MKAKARIVALFGRSAAPGRSSGDVRGNGATSHRPAFFAIPFTAALLVLLAFASAGATAAAAPPKFWKQCPAGSEAGQCSVPRGIGVDPNAPGHIYVADSVNFRIEEFSAWGEFIKAWGWGVRDGAEELQTCNLETTCRAGKPGSKPGQFTLLDGGGAVQGVAVDSSGNVYVADPANHRIQKFSPAGQFLLTFGGEVDKTTGADVCTAASGDECGAGVTGTGNGEFGTWPNSSFIAAGSDGTIYVGDQERVQEFGSDGSFKGQIALPGETVQSLAVDPSGNIYLAFAGSVPGSPNTKDNVRKVSSTGSPICTLPAKGPEAIATDAAGNVYVGVREAVLSPYKVREFDSSCTEVGLPFGEDELIESTGIATGQACLSASTLPDIYVSNSVFGSGFVRAYGPTPEPESCPPPKAPPSIDAQYALSVNSGGAVLRAAINPHFWSGGGVLGVTAYYVQYATAACIEAEGWGAGCVKQQPTPPGAALSGGAVAEDITTSGVFLAGLAPETGYRFRFVAESQGGGPVFGEGGTEGVDGGEGTFKTAGSRPLPKTDCGNQAFRGGFSANLPDCRAYEMVTPVDKGNADIVAHVNLTGYPAELDQSAVAGGKLAYSAEQAFGDALSSPISSQYIATRTGDGWSNQAINAPREGPSFNSLEGLDVHFKAFSPDLCDAWILQDVEPQLAPGAPPGFVNPYRRSNCGAEGYEALLSSPPTAESENFLPEIQGYSADGTRAVFRVKDQLSEDAAPNLTTLPAGGPYQLYEHWRGEDDLVSVLPGGAPCETGASAGSSSGVRDNNREHSLYHAVSADGTLVYFSCGGQLYLRRVDAAETVALSSGAAQFWAAAEDGSRAIFSKGEDLYEYVAATETAIKIMSHFKGMLGASDDATRIYPVSTDVLSGTEVNSEGDPAQPGKPNLYLREADGAIRFVATLSSNDARAQTDGKTPSPVSVRPFERVAHVTPDGLSAVFMSDAGLTGFDSTDANSGKVDAEVYLYDARALDGAGQIVCASCNPSGVRPAGRNIGTEINPYWAAAQIPAWETQLYSPRSLSDDGQRLFFESFEALVPRDTDGRQDVYEWERASDRERCEKDLGGELFVAGGGCLSLISSGESPTDSEFVDADPSGTDVFFKTASSLLAQDPGLVDIYDARAEGGFPPSTEPPLPCEADNCRTPAGPPDSPTPASSVFVGPGNTHARPHGCPKGKRQVGKNGKSHCVKKKQSKSRSQKKSGKKSQRKRHGNQSRRAEG